MNQDYWQKQTKGKPLFSNLLWSKPETKTGAGKLLIVGGQAEEFAHVAEAYTYADKAGAGTIRVIMPDSTAKFTKMLPNIEYAPANSSGSFAKQALSELLDAASWADGVLLAGDLGKNSETNLMLESFIAKFNGNLIISGAAQSSVSTPGLDLFNSEETVLVLGTTELQKLLGEIKYKKALTSKTGEVDLAVILHEITTEFAVSISLIFNDRGWNARKGRVTSTNLTDTSVQVFAAYSAVWCIQQPNKVFDALVCAAYELS